MKLKKDNLKKIILSILIVIMFSCVVPLQSHAAFTGILTKPICWLIIKTVDGVNLMGSMFFAPEATIKDTAGKTVEINEKIKAIEKAMDTDATGENPSGNIEIGGVTKKILDLYYEMLMSPDKIFAGDITLLNANIFSAKNVNGKIWELLPTGTSLASALKNTVSNVYILLRNICAVVLLCLLIYTGIRILLMSASPYEQAKWKQALIDWVKALCLLMFMHLIMIGIFYISDGIVEGLKQSYGNQSIVAAIRWNFHSTSFLDGTACIINMIMYLYVTYLTLVFFIAYFKRLIWIVILTIFSPVVATTYALGQKQAKIFNEWAKNYITTVLLQPFHMLIFYVLVGLPVGLLAGGNTTNHLIGTNYSNILVQLYVLISISMIRPAEKFLMKLLTVESSVSKQGTSESGVKTIKAVEKVVKETVQLVGQVVTAVATSGTSAVARSSWCTFWITKCRTKCTFWITKCRTKRTF